MIRSIDWLPWSCAVLAVAAAALAFAATGSAEPVPEPPGSTEPAAASQDAAGGKGPT